MGKCGRLLDPTAATIEAEVWLAIAGGAQGIGYFLDFWPPESASAITATNAEIAALAPALLAPEAPVSFGPEGTPVKARAPSSTAPSTSSPPTPPSRSRRRASPPGLSVPLVRVFGKGRTLPLQRDRFTDSFPGLGVHLYIAAPPGL
jgi:hypothetical protein